MSVCIRGAPSCARVLSACLALGVAAAENSAEPDWEAIRAELAVLRAKVNQLAAAAHLAARVRRCGRCAGMTGRLR
jgi:hypothetical protein